MLETLKQILTNELAIKFIVAIIGIIIINFASNIIKKYISNRIKTPEDRYHARKIITFVGYFVIFLFLLVVFYQRLRGLTIAFGLIGAGVAFSLQKVITSIAGWLAITTQHFYGIGDRIQVGNITGDVVDISLLRTALMEIGEWVESDLYTGRIVFISNGSIFDTPVHNYSASFPYLWDIIRIPVRYGSDFNLAREILQNSSNEIVKDYLEDAKSAWQRAMRNFVINKARIEPMITLETNDNWIEFTVRYIVPYDKRVITREICFLQKF
ncbi:MAG: mechanosensitive ion channel family protein [Ignavibacteriales bacterium]|nr:mechanosensitive ion channel family protein [Ignavibacteriales bacterium]